MGRRGRSNPVKQRVKTSPPTLFDVGVDCQRCRWPTTGIRQVGTAWLCSKCAAEIERTLAVRVILAQCWRCDVVQRLPWQEQRTRCRACNWCVEVLRDLGDKELTVADRLDIVNPDGDP